MSSGDTGELTLTIRVIRSFPHRNIRNIILKTISPSLSTEALIDRTISEVSTSSALPPPFRLRKIFPFHQLTKNVGRKFSYDTLKIEHHAHGAKTSDPVINTENDEELILKTGLSLVEQGVRHETELSLFKLEDYLEYKKLPVHGQTQW